MNMRFKNLFLDRLVIKRICVFSFLVFASGLNFALAQSSPASVIQAINERFRSSSHSIEADVLLKIGLPMINRDALGQSAIQQLSKMSPEDIVTGFKTCKDCQANKQVVVNIIRLNLVVKACSKPWCLTDDINRLVSNEFQIWRSSNPKMLDSFPDASPDNKASQEFDLAKYELMERAWSSPLDNDFYAFKMSASYFKKGEHTSHQVTARVFSRGHEKRNYLVAFGQEQVFDLLQNLRFTDADIDFLRQHKELKDMPVDFFEYLRKFKFTGSIRAVPTGTVVFPDEPILEITGNPIEVTLAETLIVPWINRMTNFASKAARVVQESGGRVLIEGGTRRGFWGFWSAYVASLMGFHVTSNVEVAKLTGSTTGGTEAHQWIGYWGDEVLAHAIYRDDYPETTLLVDTYDIREGIKKAIRASGAKFKGFRLDSVLPEYGKQASKQNRSADWAKEMTTREVVKLMKSMGYKEDSYTITYSDGLTEKSMRYHTEHKTPFRIALIGTDLAAPDTSHLNMVYKLIEKRNMKTGEVSYPIKLATGKVLLPGQSQIFRQYDDTGKMMKDHIGTKDEPSPAHGYQPLMRQEIVDGVRIRSDSKEITASYIKDQLGRLPLKLKSLEPTQKADRYSVEPTANAKSVQEHALRRAIKKDVKRIAYAFMSADPMHEGHVEMLKRAKIAGSFDQIIVVLTGDKRVHKSSAPLFSAKERLAIAQRHFPSSQQSSHGVSFWKGEIEGKTKYSMDTIDEIRKDLGILPGDPRYSETMIMGDDVFSTLSDWSQSERLITELNFMIVLRDKAVTSILELGDKIPAFLRDNGYQMVNKDSVASRTVDGIEQNRIELVDLKIPVVSSTEYRNRVSAVNRVFVQVGQSDRDQPQAVYQLAVQKALAERQTGKSILLERENQKLENIVSPGPFRGSRRIEMSLDVFVSDQASSTFIEQLDKMRDPRVQVGFSLSHQGDGPSKSTFAELLRALSVQFPGTELIFSGVLDRSTMNVIERLSRETGQTSRFISEASTVLQSDNALMKSRIPSISFDELAKLENWDQVKLLDQAGRSLRSVSQMSRRNGRLCEGALND